MYKRHKFSLQLKPKSLNRTWTTVQGDRNKKFSGKVQGYDVASHKAFSNKLRLEKKKSHNVQRTIMCKVMSLNQNLVYNHFISSVFLKS